MDKDKIFLHTDFVKYDRINETAKRICRLINEKVIPSLSALDLLDIDKVMYYAEDSERVYADYKAKNLKGIDKVSLYLRRMAEEDVNDRLYNTIGDGWGTQNITDEIKQVLSFAVNDDVIKVSVNEEKLTDICNVYINSDAERKAYDKLKSICNSLNMLTGCKDYSNMVIVCNDNVWEVNNYINFKNLN